MQLPRSFDQTVHKKSKLVSIIVPTYQEVGNLSILIARISRAMKKIHRPYEVIIVDDNSQDGSDKTIAKLAEKGYPVRIIIRFAERGLSSAVIRGFREAKGRELVCLDADLSHPPEVIPKLLDSLKAGKYDFAIGSRYVPGASIQENWGLFRSLNSKIATLFARPFTNVRDPMSGFFALPRVIFEQADKLDPIGYKIGLELIVKCSCRNISEIPIHFADREHGQSKLRFKEQLNYLKHLKRLADFKYGNFSRLIQFCLVGSTGMVIDLGTYIILLRSGIAITLARGLAIWLAMTWNFWLNRRLTFSYSRPDSILKQYPRFLASCGIGAFISWSIAVLIPHKVTMFANHLLLAATIGIAVGTLLNFLLSRYWVFKRLSTLVKIPESKL